ncbi:hypothetical protein V6Z11_A07G083300 [Gossypium hirsutum]
MEYWGWWEVDFGRDSWLKNCEPLMNSSIQPDLASSNNVPICNMTDHIGDWNWTQFKHLLTEPIALKISALRPPLQSNIPDFPGWRWERRHVFITMSGYYYAMDNQNSLEPDKQWRCFWSYDDHHRVNFHVSGDQQKLLIKENRFRRHLVGNPVCCYCGDDSSYCRNHFFKKWNGDRLRFENERMGVATNPF